MRTSQLWSILAAGCVNSLVGSTLSGHEPGHVDPRAFGAIMVQLSPAGDLLAFSYQGAIWRMAREGGKMTRLTHGEGFDIEPVWSPDGQRIALVNSRNFGSAGVLTLIDARTGEKIETPLELAVAGKVYFDRAGRKVLGLFQPEKENQRLAWFDLESGELTGVVAEGSWPGLPIGTPGIQPPHFALSHRNRWLAVIVTADVPGEQTGNQGPQNEIWKVPLEDGQRERIAVWPARIHDLCWSADDAALFVATDRGGVHHDLWEIPLDGPDDPEGPDGAARKLTSGQADESSPSVSDDGRWLVYTDNRHGPTMVVSRELADGHEHIVAPANISHELDFGSPTGRLRLEVVEGADESPTTARVVVRHSDGKFHAAPGALYRVLGTDLHSYIHDGAELVLPVGRYSVKAMRGMEHRSAEASLEIRADETTELTLKLARWTRQRDDGWISGENHIHANYGYGHWYNSPATMWLQCDGEDLTVANFMVANSDGDGVFDREFFLGRPDPQSTDDTILYWNEEFRSTIWGHMTLLNLQYLVTPIFTGFKHTTHPHDIPTNADIADHVHDQDGHVNYTHPAHNLQDPYAGAYSAKEMPIDIALGKVDSIDVMGTGHVANLPLWYRLLNCGLRVPASAGTDCFLNRIASRLPGSDRVYVHCRRPFTYRDWIDNLRAGRTFVTNGPMLRFAVNGQEAGATVGLDGPGTVHVSGEATWQFPLERLEVLVNGVVQEAEEAAAGGAEQLRFDRDVTIDRGGWIALRVQGKPGPDQLVKEAFAHSSAVYLEVAGRPVASPEDAEFFIRWIERLRDDVRKRDQVPARHAPHIERQLADAIEFYRRLAAPADDPADDDGK